MDKQTEEWINLIESETQIEPDSAFYELIQHKTDFFLDGALQFSACELIIEVYSDEDFEHNIYPELYRKKEMQITALLDNGKSGYFTLNGAALYILFGKKWNKKEWKKYLLN